MMAWAIAAYLTDQQKRAMARARYTSRGATWRQRLTADGCCPLGVAIPDAFDNPSAPDADTVALMCLREMDYDQRDYEALREAINLAAAEFINAWDDGILKPADLPRVLGLRGRRRDD